MNTTIDFVMTVVDMAGGLGLVIVVCRCSRDKLVWVDDVDIVSCKRS